MEEKEITEESMEAICGGCGYHAHPDKFNGCLTAYHDLRCPNCGTTSIDTSQLVKAWEKRGEVYGFGQNNKLQN